MVYSLLLMLVLAGHADATYVDGPLHALTTYPTTSFETYSRTLTPSRPTTTDRTTSHRTRPAPVTNRVFTAQNIAVTRREPAVTNFTYLYSSMTPLPSPTSSHTPPDSTLTNLPNTTVPVTQQQDEVTKLQDHVTKQQDEVTKQQGYVTKQQDHMTTQKDHVTKQQDPVITHKDHVTTRRGYNWTVQGDTPCDGCVLVRPVGYLVSCLVVVGLFSNLLSYLYFWRRASGTAGLIHGLFIATDVLLLLCCVPIAVSFIRFQTSSTDNTTIPLTYSKVWFYIWNFTLRYNFFLLSLLSLRFAAEFRGKTVSKKAGMLLSGGGGVILLIITLLPLFFKPVYVKDYSLLLYDVNITMGFTFGFYGLMGTLVLVTIAGIFVVTIPYKKKYSLIALGRKTNGRTEKRENTGIENVGNHRLFTVLFCVLNLASKSPFIIVHSVSRSRANKSPTPLFTSVLIILVLGAALINTVMHVLAYFCRSRDQPDQTTRSDTGGPFQEQPV